MPCTVSWSVRIKGLDMLKAINNLCLKIREQAQEVQIFIHLEVISISQTYV